MAYFYFGDHAVTGEKIIARILLGLADEKVPWREDDLYCYEMRGRKLPADPAGSGGQGSPCPGLLVGEVVPLLVIGRQYPLPLTLTADWVVGGHALDVEKYRLGIAGNGLLIAVIRGEDSSLVDSFGMVNELYLPDPYAAIPPRN